MKDYILASKSPRRKALFRNLIESFLIISPDIDETRKNGESPKNHVQRISAMKAQAGSKLLSTSTGKDWVIVAADTIVVDKKRILGKPVDEEDAAQMLLGLRGRTHTVYSGFTVYDTSQEAVQTRTVSSKVRMREYTEDEIKAYVASGDPLDKAGAYAIQNHDFDPAPDFSECFANVMGLPLCHLAVLLNEMGCPRYEDVAERCQSSIDYQCPIFTRILSGTRGKERA
jgi:MAF protein